MLIQALAQLLDDGPITLRLHKDAEGAVAFAIVPDPAMKEGDAGDEKVQKARSTGVVFTGTPAELDGGLAEKVKEWIAIRKDALKSMDTAIALAKADLERATKAATDAAKAKVKDKVGQAAAKKAETPKPAKAPVGPTTASLSFDAPTEKPADPPQEKSTPQSSAVAAEADAAAEGADAAQGGTVDVPPNASAEPSPLGAPASGEPTSPVAAVTIDDDDEQTLF